MFVGSVFSMLGGNVFDVSPKIGTKHFGLISQFCATGKPPTFDASAPD
jgi:hypothetical protein